MKQQHVNKWTTAFECQPYQVIEKHGNSVVVESPKGVQYKRNTTRVKPFQERESGPEVELTVQVPEIHPEKKGLH